MTTLAVSFHSLSTLCDLITKIQLMVHHLQQQY